MSEYQRDKGEVMILSVNPTEFEEIALTILKEKECDITEISENYKATEYLSDYFYGEYIITKKVFAQIIKSTIMESECDFCDLTHSYNRTYSFHTMYYNGGTCMIEMVAEELDKLF